MAPPEPVSFAPRELLALFPEPPPPTPFPSGAAGPPDPAADARAQSPLTKAALLSALARSPALQFATRVQLGDPSAAHLFARSALLFVSTALVAVVPPALSASGSLQLAIGTAAFLLAVAVPLLVLPLAAKFRASLAPRHTADLSAHCTAGLARWQQLVAGDAPSPLTAHDPADELCPCPAASCAGGCVGKADWQCAAEWAVKYCLWLFIGLCTCWSAFFAPGALDRAWSIVVVAQYLAVSILIGFAFTAARLYTSPPLLEVTDRLRRRAVDLALAGMLAPLRAGAESLGASPFPSPPPPGTLEPFQELHLLLTSFWARRVRRHATSLPILLTLGPYLAWAVANAAACACIPSYYLSYFAYIAAVSLYDLVAVAAENRAVDGLRGAYGAALRELRLLRDRVALSPAPATGDRNDLLAALGARAELLGCFAADLDACRARLLGFVVDGGVLRTLAATALTLLVGVWGILRGLGVVVVMGTICPVR